MIEIGRPRFFNLQTYYDLIHQFINSDEVETALFLLDNPPAYYRDHPPVELTRLKERLHKQLWTPVTYRGIYKDLEMTGQQAEQSWPIMGHVIEGIVKEANNRGVIPNIMELSPGSYWLPYGLEHKGLNFTYEALSLDPGVDKFEKPKGWSENIFVCLELIEHLHNPLEIYQNYLKFEKIAATLVVSTPLYCYGGGMENWQDRELGHLRCFTPSEFHLTLSKMFQGYTWSCLTQDNIVLIGRLNA